MSAHRKVYWRATTQVDKATRDSLKRRWAVMAANIAIGERSGWWERLPEGPLQIQASSFNYAVAKGIVFG